ncbi:cytochrome P450 [Xylariaceae sp. AK1471]|nr:cytochrome P450 [Xylariaceae sp. AK1471]
MDLKDVILVLTAILVSYVVTDFLYYITFHPLAKIPGPKLCGVSRIPYWTACITGTDVFWLHKLHVKYGPIVRFGPWDVSFAAAEAWKPVYGVKPKANIGGCYEGHPSMLSANYENHRRVRRVFAPAFSEGSLRKHESLVRKYVDKLIAKADELSQRGNVEVSQLFNFTTFDIMGEFCFGLSLGQLESNQYDPWVRAIFGQLKAFPFMSIIMYYPILTRMFSLFEPNWIREARIAHCKFAADLVDKRIDEEPTENTDIWRLVIKELSREEMHSNAEFFLVAGSETTATLLSSTLFYLLKNPNSMTRLRQEVCDRFKSVDEFTFEALAKMPYLNACLTESGRIFPGVAVGSPRVVYEGGQSILGYFLPANTAISVHHWSTYHSEANFKHPDLFVPERWLGDPLYDSDVREAHQPFNHGPRDCLGQSFAKHEIRMIIAALVLTFDIQLCDESLSWDKEVRCYALWERGSITCHVSRANSSARV